MGGFLPFLFYGLVVAWPRVIQGENMQQNIMNSVVDFGRLEAAGVFEGYASVFDHTDSVSDRVIKGAFAESLKRSKANGTMPPLLWQHDTGEPIGKWREIREDSHGLYVKGELYIEDIPRARQAYRLMMEEALTGLSIGFKTEESHRDPKTRERVLTKVNLLEISLVTFPALESARIRRIKKSFSAGQMPDERSLEAYLREAGFSRKQAKGFIAAGYKSLTARDAQKATEKNEVLYALRHLTEQIKRSTPETMKG